MKRSGFQIPVDHRIRRVDDDAGRAAFAAKQSYRPALCMLTFHINRAGKNLPASRKRKLIDAKEKMKRLFHKDKPKKERNWQRNSIFPACVEAREV